MLAGPFFMVAEADIGPHFFQGQHHVPAGVFTQVDRCKVAISGAVMGSGGRVAVIVCIKR
jgi:hypothetical protein